MIGANTLIEQFHSMNFENWVGLVHKSGKADIVFRPKNIMALFSKIDNVQKVRNVLEYMAKKRFNDFMALQSLFTFTEGDIGGPKNKYDVDCHGELWSSYLVHHYIEEKDIKGLLKALEMGMVNFLQFRFNCIDINMKEKYAAYFMLCFLGHKFNVHNMEEKYFIDSTIYHIFNGRIDNIIKIRVFMAATKVVCDNFDKIKCDYAKDCILQTMKGYGDSWFKVYIIVYANRLTDHKYELLGFIKKVHSLSGKFEISELPEEGLEILLSQEVANMLTENERISCSFAEKPVKAYCCDDVINAEKAFSNLGKKIVGIHVSRTLRINVQEIKELIKFAMGRSLPIYTSSIELVDMDRSKVGIDELAHKIAFGKNYNDKTIMLQDITFD